MKKVHVGETECPRRRGGLVVRCKDGVKEYMHEIVVDRGGGIELTRRQCLDRERWRLTCSVVGLVLRTRGRYHRGCWRCNCVGWIVVVRGKQILAPIGVPHMLR